MVWDADAECNYIRDPDASRIAPALEAPVEDTAGEKPGRGKGSVTSFADDDERRSLAIRTSVVGRAADTAERGGSEKWGSGRGLRIFFPPRKEAVSFVPFFSSSLCHVFPWCVSIILG